MRQIIYIPEIARDKLASLKNDPALVTGVHIVYVYFLLNRLIPYPKGESNILYIGEAMRKAGTTGARLGQHITQSDTNGANTGNNFVLSQYFHAGWSIGLAIFKTDIHRKERERELIYAHISLYGSPPIAQGKIPHDPNGKNRTNHIASFIANNKKPIDKAATILIKLRKSAT